MRYVFLELELGDTIRNLSFLIMVASIVCKEVDESELRDRIATLRALHDAHRILLHGTGW